MSTLKFFMVYVEDGNSPVFQHETLEAAEREAKRLSKALNKKSYVMCSLKSFELNEFKIEDCRPIVNDDLPF